MQLMSIVKILTFVCGAWISFSFASQTKFQPFTSFDVVSGNIRVVGEVVGGRCKSLSIFAFKRKHVLSQKQLNKISICTANGLILTSEAGYPGFGGETVYIRLVQAFGEKVIQSQVIAVSSEKGIKVKKQK